VQERRSIRRTHVCQCSRSLGNVCLQVTADQPDLRAAIFVTCTEAHGELCIMILRAEQSAHWLVGRAQSRLWSGLFERPRGRRCAFGSRGGCRRRPERSGR